MKRILIVSLAATLWALSAGTGLAADSQPAAATNAAVAELKQLVTKVQGQLKDGKKSEADLAGSLKEFDTLLAKHAAEKTDDVAQILFMKAMLYLQVLDNTDKGIEVVKQLKKDFPDTKMGQEADTLIAKIQHQAEGKKVRDQLAEGAVFPDFNEKDLDGKPLSIANYKGKVVLIDFWATWCGPCVQELPNVLATYKKHHADGFEIIGISLDQDKGKLTSFMKQHAVTWAQYFDGKGWENKLAGKYGVTSIPATYLLDGQGKIVAKDLRGEALEAEVAKQLAKK